MNYHDDTIFHPEGLSIPIIQVIPGRYPGGYVVDRTVVEYADIFGQVYKLQPHIPVCRLFDRNHVLWMSDTPQERIMMYNHAKMTMGKVLIGGLGLGIYLQYAQKMGRTEEFYIVEKNRDVLNIVRPILETIHVPYTVIIDDIEHYLMNSATLFDTIFLDTWDTVNPIYLPHINHLRNLASKLLSPDGKVLLWGYVWMLRLFEDGCKALLTVDRHERRNWLSLQSKSFPKAVQLLEPIEQHFRDKEYNDIDLALAWCRGFIVEYIERKD